MTDLEKIRERTKSALTIALSVVHEVFHDTAERTFSDAVWLQSAVMLVPKIYEELKHDEEARIRNAAAGFR